MREAENFLEEVDAQIIGMIRNEFRVSAPNMRRLLRAGDVLIIEAEPEALSAVLSGLGLVLEEHAREEVGHDKEAEKDSGKNGDEKETILQELAVMPNSRLIGRTASNVRMRTRYGLILLAISRTGQRSINRMRSTVIRAGDVLLVQGEPGSLSGFASGFGCVPLAARAISIPDSRKTILSVAVMIFAIGGAAFGLLPAAISFATGVLALILIGHQNNTLILGPGGFRFGDYWKLGLPMEILVVAIGIPMLLIVWPL